MTLRCSALRLLELVVVRETDHYKVVREFCDDPDGFVRAVVEE